MAPESLELLRSAHEGADVVHTLRAKRLVDPIYLLHALRKQKLPRPTWLHDHPFARNPSTKEALLENVREGQSSLLFLRRPRSLGTRGLYSERHVEALVALQRDRERPIRLLPVTLQWHRQPVGLRRSLIDAVFGAHEEPAAFREILGFLWRYGDARFHVGAPVDLKEVVEREPELADKVIAKKVRWTILHHLAREEQLRTGPVHRSPARTRQAVKNDPQVRRLIASSSEQGKDRAELEAKTDKHLKKIAADMSVTWLRIFDVFIDFLWNRIYDGIQVDPEGLALVRRAARRGPVVVVPSHKSHVDYLVLSQVFFKNDLIPPHIAAGENLDFWPIGGVFRKGGAFFLRRSFRGDKLYAAVFAAYVRRLLKEGHALEFFIEGGRSRTGKVLLPKMGMLTMCARPVLEGNIPDVSFIPVSIGYEKVIEAGSYAKELAGGSKKKEDVTSLVSSARVLGARYGRVYVDFDEPVSLREMVEDRGVEIPVTDDNRVAKPLINYLGHRIVYGINRVTRVTPTSVAALVLLASERKGMAEDELRAKTARALDFLAAVGARRSAALDTGDHAEAVKTALGRLARDRLVMIKASPGGQVVYQLDESGRIALDYYKNNILHFFVPAAIVAAAVLTAGRDHAASEEAVATWALRISQILKNEISFRVDSTFEDNYEEAKTLLRDRGTLAEEKEGWRVSESGEEEARALAGLLASFFDSYRLMGETLKMLEQGAAKERKILDAALAEARSQALDGRLARAESASQPVMRQALSLYLGERAVLRGEGGDILIGEPGRREGLLQEIRILLDAQPT